MKIALVWDMKPCSLIDVHQCPVIGSYCVASKCRTTFSNELATS